MPLYDAFDRLLPDSEASSSPKNQGDTQPTKPPAEAVEPPRSPQSLRPKWLSGRRLFAELGGIGLIVGLFAVRPVLSVTAFNGTGIDNIYGVKITVTETGMMPITDVLVQCVTNKVIFDDRFTVEFDKYVRVDEYSVGSVGAGESFTVNCTFAWSMWEKGEDLVLIAGFPTPGYFNLGIHTKYRNGMPETPEFCPIGIAFGFPDAVTFRNRKLTAADGSFVIHYKWKFSPVPQTRVIRVIESPGPEDGLKWRVAPESEPITPDAALRSDGWKMTARSNSAEFGVTMKGGKYKNPSPEEAPHK